MERNSANASDPGDKASHIGIVVATTLWLNLLTLGVGIAIVAVVTLISGAASAFVAVPAFVAGGVIAAFAWKKVMSETTPGRVEPPTGTVQSARNFDAVGSKLSAASPHPAPAGRG